jgi:transcriptional regulator with XRE-family HTH domain
MILIRRLLGDVLRRKRQDEGRTLRQLAAAARISPGYLSEIERGQKEPSSELLAAICDALQARLSDVLREVSIELAAAELAAQLESERIGVAAPVPTARVGAAAGSGAVKSMPLAKPVPRGAVRPGTRPAARPVTRRVPAAAGVGATMTSTPNLLAYPVVLPGGLNAGSLPVAGSGQVPQLALR